MAGLAGSVAVMLDPIGAAGVGQNSTYMSDVYGRVRRSNSVFMALAYGDTVTALKAGRDLFRRHSHVNGVVPTTGEPYRANLPDALLFTYLAGFPCLVESFRKYSGETFTEADDSRPPASQRSPSAWAPHVTAHNSTPAPAAASRSCSTPTASSTGDSASTATQSAAPTPQPKDSNCSPHSSNAPPNPFADNLEARSS